MMPPFGSSLVGSAAEERHPHPWDADMSVIADAIEALLREREQLTKDEICLAFTLTDEVYASLREEVGRRRGIRKVGGKTGGLALDRRMGLRPTTDEPLPLSPLQQSAVDRLLEVLSKETLVELTERRMALELAEEGTNPRISARRAAEILVLHYDQDLLWNQDLRQAVGKALRIEAPKRWSAGKGAAVRFVTEAGFPLEFAGIAIRERLEPVELIEPSGEVPPLQDFQRDLKDKIRHILLDQGARAIASLPTGAGKTRTAVEGIVEWLLDGGRGPGTTVIWIAHTGELCEQACECIRQVWTESSASEPLRLLRRFGNLRPSVEDLTDATLPTVVVTTAAALDGVAGSIVRDTQLRDALTKFETTLGEENAARLRSILDRTRPGASGSPTDSHSFFVEVGKRLGAVIIDEAHRSAAKGYRAILDWAQGLPFKPSIVGLTATPFRSGGVDSEETRQLSQLFREQLLIPDQLGDQPRIALQRLGVLANPIVTDVGSGLKIRQLPDDPMRVDEAMRLWTDNRMRRRVIVDRLVAIAQDPSTSILYFGPTVEDAHAVALLLRLRGIQAQGVDGGTRREVRRLLIQRFRQRELQVLCNCELLTTGFDSPKVTHVVVGRPTTSQVLYEQMVGRGLRGPKFGGTTECHILDIIDGFPGTKPSLGYEAFREHWQVARFRLDGASLFRDNRAVGGLSA